MKNMTTNPTHQLIFFQIASNTSDAEVQTEIPLHNDNFMFEYDVKDVKPFVKHESEF